MTAGLSRRAVLGAAVALAAGCRAGSPAAPAAPSTPPSAAPPTQPPPAAAATPAEVAARATVPVLCYHQLRDHTPADSAYSRRLLVCPPAAFRSQLDALATAGWTTIGPDAYLDHLLTGAPLPARPVLLSFDDAQGTQATEALPQLSRRGMTGTFFAMTVVLDKRGWLSRDDLRRLRDAGMTVAAHTYDHHRVDRYTAPDWPLQLEQPRALLEQVVGVPVEHFAYPYGAWDPAALPHVRAAGYRSAYQLADRPLDPAEPALTLRRVLVDSTWTGDRLLQQLA